MQNISSKNVPAVYIPSRGCGSKLLEFRRRIQEKYSVKIEDFWDLHKWSIENVPEFWEEMWHHSGIIHSKTFDQVVDMSVSMSDRPEWFKGARLNFAENLLKFRNDEPALILTGEEKQLETLTYAQLYEEVSLYAAALRKFGLEKGDRVVCYVPARKEPIFVFLGAASIGAIFAGAQTFLGVQGVLNKLLPLHPKILFTTDKYLHGGKEYELLKNVEEIVKALPSLEKVVIIPSNSESKNKSISSIPNSCLLESFLALGRERNGSVPIMRFEQLPFSHPVFITHTSGTSGASKAVVSGCGRLLSSARDYNLHSNRIRNKRYFSASCPVTASWTLSVMGLFVGSPLVYFDGYPYFLTPTFFWDLVDDLKITRILLRPHVLNELENQGCVPTENHHLQTLTDVFMTSGIANQKNYDFVKTKVKKNIRINNVYACTEIGSILLCDHTLPIYKGEITSPAYGLDVQCYNDEGECVTGQKGEIVTRTPMPSLPLGIWGDEDGSIFKKEYFSKYPDVFSLGDIGFINPVTRGTIICGRNSTTLKQNGYRFESSEIGNVVESLKEIADSLSTSYFDKDMTESLVLFVKINKNCVFDEHLIVRIKNAIETQLSHAQVPKLILQVPDIPYSMRGKKMETLVSKIVNNVHCDIDNVFNPECLDSFRNIPELKNN